MWIYFWALYSVPLIHKSVFVAIPSITCTLFVQPGHTPSPLGCFPIAKPRPTPGSALWNLSFSIQSLPTPSGRCLGLRSEAIWPGPSVGSLYSAGWQASPYTLLSSLWSSLSVLVDLMVSEGGCQGEGSGHLSQLPPRSAGPVPLPLLPFPFILPS